MFKRKKKLELNNDELRILFSSLNDFRNALLEENKYPDPVNETMVKLKSKMRVDKYDLGVMINGLDRTRKEMVKNDQDTSNVDQLLLRLLKINEE